MESKLQMAFAAVLLSIILVIQGTPVPESSPSSSAPPAAAEESAAAAPSAQPAQGARLLALFPLGADKKRLQAIQQYLSGYQDAGEGKNYGDLLGGKEKDAVPDSDGQEGTRFLAILQGVGGGKKGGLPIVGAILDAGKNGTGLPIVGGVLGGGKNITGLPIVGGLLGASSAPDADGGAGSRLAGLTGKGKTGGNLGDLIGGLPIIGSLPLINGLLGADDPKGGKGKKKLAVFTNIPLVGGLVGGLSGKKDVRPDSNVDDFGNDIPTGPEIGGDRSAAGAGTASGAAPSPSASESGSEVAGSAPSSPSSASPASSPTSATA